jgi:methylamine---corrinoid protein Co-methyltransferase
MKIDKYENLLSVIDKSETGPVVPEKEWDRQYIGKTIKRLVKKYDVSWEAGAGVPADDALADRVFEAGMELARESGLYHLETHRRLIWTQDELDKVLAEAPSEITVGAGEDQATFHSRKTDEDSRVTVIGGPYGTLIPEELFVPLMLTYAREPLLDLIDNASLATSMGRAIRAHAPMEAICSWQEAQLTFEVLEKAGRPGLSVGCAANSASEISEITSTTYGGFRPTDWHHSSLVSELKLSNPDLLKATHFAHTGSFSHNFFNPIYGGYVGGGEGMAVVIVAGMVLMRASLMGETVNAGPSHAHLSCDTFPAMVPSQAIALSALSRNTHLITSGFMRPVAGPCVRDILYEIAALAIASVTSGAAFIKGVHSATGRFMGHTTALEARFTAQVSHAAEGMTRADADPIVRRLMAKYADRMSEIQIGKPFQEAYNLDTLEPIPEWQGMYDEVCQELDDEFGLKL